MYNEQSVCDGLTIYENCKGEWPNPQKFKIKIESGICDICNEEKEILVFLGNNICVECIKKDSI